VRPRRLTVPTRPLRTLADIELITADYVPWYNQQRLMHCLDRIPPAEARYYAQHVTDQPAGSQKSRVHETRDASQSLSEVHAAWGADRRLAVWETDDSSGLRRGEPVNNDPHHYPPDLVAVLVDTVPVLVRSKRDTVEFFRGSGVADRHLVDLEHRLATDRDSVSKYEIARTVVSRINAEGDSGLRARREIVRRVVEWGDFSTCWPEKALEARGLVAKARDLVNAKDAFTRMQQEREHERQERLRPQREAAAAAQRKRTEREALRREVGALFRMDNAHQRGLAFERLLNQVFALDGLNVREGFALCTEGGQIGEQIDGLVELGSQRYLVEAKWWKSRLGVDGVAPHLVRIYSRSGVHGLIVSASGFAEPAVEQCRSALSQKVIILAELREIVMLLESHGDFAAWLRVKTRAATVDRNPLFFPELDQVA